jgi:hypothetical protein
MGHNIGVFAITFPSLCHLICSIVSSDRNNHLSLGVIGM